MPSDALYQTWPHPHIPPEVARLPSLAFGTPIEKIQHWLTTAGTHNVRVMRRPGVDAPDACLLLIPMAQFFGGRSVPMVGVAGVATAPEARGRGLATRMMVECLREMHAAGFALSTLYSALHPLYRGVGYECAGLCDHSRVPCGLLPKGDPGAGWREVRERDDMPLLRACYSAYARARHGHPDRGDYLWDRVFRPRSETSTGFIALTDRGDAEAFAFVRLGPWSPMDNAVGTASGNVLTLDDAAWSTPHGLRRLLGFLRGYSSVVGEIHTALPANSPFFLAFDDRRHFTRVQERWMLRVLCVRRALAGRGYLPGLTGELHLDVRDPLIPANQGRWVLRVRDGLGEIEPGGDGRLALDVRTLAPLFTGYATAWELAGAGLLSGDEPSLATASALFAWSMPTMTERF